MLKSTTILAVFLICALGAGCLLSKSTSNPDNYQRIAVLGLEGARTALMVAKSESVKAKHFEGCVTSYVLEEAIDAASRTISAKIKGDVVIPALSVDLSDCMVFKDDPAEGTKIPDLSQKGIQASLYTAQYYALKLAASDCKKGQVALAAFGYLEGLQDAIVSEPQKPDGVFEVPAQSVDLSMCE